MFSKSAYDDHVRNYGDETDGRVTELNNDWMLDEIDTLGDDAEFDTLYDDEPEWDRDEDEDEY